MDETTLAAIAKAGAGWLTERQLAAMVAEVRRLRAILAPLLDSPADPCDGEFCVFCGHGGQGYEESRRRHMHLLDCPVLSRDEILGRSE